jgi:hypothetical protein
MLAAVDTIAKGMQKKQSNANKLEHKQKQPHPTAPNQ